MRSVHALLVGLTLASPAIASAKAWQGITPGASTRDDVVARFGVPSTEGQLGGGTALVYRDDRAIAGTRQAQFLVRDGGVVSEIDVFPTTQLDRDSVEGTYGKATQKTFTDDFRPAWIYRSLGVKVFFGKDGTVEAIRFEPGAPGAPAPGPPDRTAKGGTPAAPERPAAAASTTPAPAPAAPASSPPPAKPR
jgi:hypothetical protein